MAARRLKTHAEMFQHLLDGGAYTTDGGATHVRLVLGRLTLCNPDGTPDDDQSDVCIDFDDWDGRIVRFVYEPKKPREVRGPAAVQALLDGKVLCEAMVKWRIQDGVLESQGSLRSKGWTRSDEPFSSMLRVNFIVEGEFE